MGREVYRSTYPKYDLKKYHGIDCKSPVEYQSWQEQVSNQDTEANEHCGYGICCYNKDYDQNCKQSEHERYYKVFEKVKKLFDVVEPPCRVEGVTNTKGC